MATSFVEYREKGFWCDGAYLKLWLYLLIKEAESEANIFQNALPAQLIEQWRFMATIMSGSAIELSVDELLANKHDKRLLIKIIGKLHQKLLSYGYRIPAQLIIDANRDIKGSIWEEAPLTNSIAKVGVLFQRLLRYKLATNASSPLYYLEFNHWNSLELY